MVVTTSSFDWGGQWRQSALPTTMAPMGTTSKLSGGIVTVSSVPHLTMAHAMADFFITQQGCGHTMLI